MADSESFTCQATDCEKTASFRCPKCLKLGLPPKTASFCSQDCFKKMWSTHKELHKTVEPQRVKGSIVPGLPAKFRGFQFTGPLRNAEVTPQVVVPNHIEKTDYAVSGWPASEMKYRATIPIAAKKSTVEAMRIAGRLGGKCLELCEKMAQPGITTDAIDKAVHALIIGNNAYPSPLNYNHFPKSLCTSLNEVICHGIPDMRPLEDGDILNCDITVYIGGVHADLNATFLVGDNVDDESRRLVQCARECLQEAIKIVKPGVLYRDIGRVIEKVAKREKFSVVRSYCGHGINTLFHTVPNVPHYAKNKAVGAMKVGHTFTIEPMINAGDYHDTMWPDDWTVVTVDGKRSAQFEHTLLVTEKGCEILSVDSKDYVFDQSAVRGGGVAPVVAGTNVFHNLTCDVAEVAAEATSNAEK